MEKTEEKSPKDIVKDVEKELKGYNSQFESAWANYEDAYYGDIWKQFKGYRPVENDIFPIIEAETALLTDTISGVMANVDDPAYLDQAKNLSKSIEWVLKQQNLQSKRTQLVRNSLIGAPGWLFIDYDYAACEGDGEHRFEVLHWSQVRLDGNASFIEDCEKAQVDLFKTKNWLSKRYPKYADKIQKMSGKKEAEDKHAWRGKETQDVGFRFKRQRPLRHTSDDILKLQITYIKDYTLEAIPFDVTQKELEEAREQIMEMQGAEVNFYQDHANHIEFHKQLDAELKARLQLPPETTFDQVEDYLEQLQGENTEANFGDIMLQLKVNENTIKEHEILQKENPKGGRLKYRDGWRVIETIQNIVVYDGESRYKHGEISLVPWYCYKDNTIYGFSEVANLYDSQQMQAVMTYKEYKGLQKVANPSITIFKESGLTKDDVTNEDGAVYEIKEGSREPVYNQPGVVSQQVSNFRQERKIRMQDISGINKAAQGEMPSPIASGVTVERIQTQAIGRVRLKDRMNDYSMKRLGKIVAANILQFWTTEKTIKLENKNGDYQQIIFNPLEMMDLKYEIDITPGSMAGVDKDTFNGLLAQFLNAGHITLDQFLQVAEIPKTEKLKEIVSQDQQIQEQMQQLKMENLQLKGQFIPETLTPEEAQLLQSNMQGLNNEQPVT